ncbi:glycosyl hydrolase [Rudanella paleaurantiibacter]|uniref:Glycosyl hydrolase n=1 Tax=Rudanella paleaurantiibacter TaxID=2614655 RepID=A0A7J5TU47_9BACT|nr:glycosyl hydrolase [Rudanella paleaurantiibacter]KAB7727525.1 glycosyl hydrolase [Rudanella paleaurantiibacter]
MLNSCTALSVTVLAGLLLANPTLAQRKKTKAPTATVAASAAPATNKLLEGMRWRNIGPFRAGRALAAAGHPDQPLTYYFGATGGGVWKTVDGGANWTHISDSTFKSSSVGAITVAPSDPNVLYVGMGEAEIRGNIANGDGVYKSTDAGKTWKHIGLKMADAIGNIEVHPQNPDIAYVAALGNPFAPNKERGIFRTTDGGKTWQHILSKNDSTGAACIKMDPSNPRVLYASLWQAYRNSYQMSSGGPGCGLYKSTDGGDTWVSLNNRPGMPKGMLGKIGITVSPANPNRLYAMIESAKGGLYRSDDAGNSWQLINEDKNLWQRPWYYMMLAADPQNENGLIVLNVSALKSTDGGKTFTNIPVHHSDTHDIWWNPKNPQNYIIADDGGGEVTYNGGATFSDIDIPTAQFYHVALDNDFPYNVYGAQQDNSSIRIASRTTGYSIGPSDWWSVAGGESGYITPDPKDVNVTFGGSYDGLITRYDKNNDQNQVVNVYPEYSMGAPSSARKYRFQWTYPIVFSPHDNNVLFCTSQFVHRSTDNGHSWEDISPDLTRNDPKTQGDTGGPITKDNTGAETFPTVYSFAESPLEKGVYWAGSDDGLMHISRDAGKTWQKITPSTSLVPEWALISIIHPSDHTTGKAYVAAKRYMSGDRKPYLLKTTDYGKTWTPITNGIPADEYCHVVREDPNQPGLLYTGTERGVYVSFNDGASWQPLNLNLPITPIRDLQIHKREKDLVVATHGRSFWIMDDVTPLHEMAANTGSPIADKTAHLFKPRHAYRMDGGAGGRRGAPTDQGENAPNGVLVRYALNAKPDKEVKLLFMTTVGDTIISYSSQKDKKGQPLKVIKDFYEDADNERADVVATKPGLNTFLWDMRYPDATAVEGTNIMWTGRGTGAKVVPGMYKVQLLIDNKVVGEQPIEIRKNPKINTSADDYRAQFELLQKINNKISETHKGVNQIRQIRNQINGYLKDVKDPSVAEKFKKATKPMLDELDQLESTLMQPKSKAFQDALAYPIRLNDKLAGVASVVSSADTKPTKASYTVFEDLSKQADTALGKLKELVQKQIPAFNQMVAEQRMPAINAQ